MVALHGDHTVRNDHLSTHNYIGMKYYDFIELLHVSRELFGDVTPLKSGLP